MTSHGTVSRYNTGCRCPSCRAANAAASRRKRQRRTHPQARVATAPRLSHTSPSDDAAQPQTAAIIPAAMVRSSISAARSEAAATGRQHIGLIAAPCDLPGCHQTAHWRADVPTPAAELLATIGRLPILVCHAHRGALPPADWIIRTAQ